MTNIAPVVIADTYEIVAYGPGMRPLARAVLGCYGWSFFWREPHPYRKAVWTRWGWIPSKAAAVAQIAKHAEERLAGLTG